MTTTDDIAAWTEEQRTLLDAILDRIVPPSPDGELPSAGKLGVGDFLAARRSDTEGFAELFDRGLKAAETLVREKSSNGVGAIAPEDLDALLYTLQANEPEFFTLLVRQTYMGYYTHPSVPPHFGLPDRPPQPLGHQVPPDESLEELLKPVRERGKCYREC